MQAFLNEAELSHESIPVDGYMGCRSGKALQTFLNANWDTAGFREAQLSVDGCVCRRTVRALQTFLNAHMVDPAAPASQK